MKVKLIYPGSDLLTKEVDTKGFNIWAFLLGILWYAIKGMWSKFFIYLLITTVVGACTFGFGVIVMWFVMGFRFNKEYLEFLLIKGYRVERKKNGKSL